MNRRQFLTGTASSSFFLAGLGHGATRAQTAASAAGGAFKRVRPGEPGWPTETRWNALVAAWLSHLDQVRFCSATSPTVGFRASPTSVKLMPEARWSTFRTPIRAGKTAMKFLREPLLHFLL